MSSSDRGPKPDAAPDRGVAPRPSAGDASSGQDSAGAPAWMFWMSLAARAASIARKERARRKRAEALQGRRPRRARTPSPPREPTHFLPLDCVEELVARAVCAAAATAPERDDALAEPHVGPVRGLRLAAVVLATPRSTIGETIQELKPEERPNKDRSGAWWWASADACLEWWSAVTAPAMPPRKKRKSRSKKHTAPDNGSEPWNYGDIRRAGNDE